MSSSTPLIWKRNDSIVRILPDRGRIQGIKLDGYEALWQPSKTDDDWNLGGERLWIGPEANWFWSKTDKVDFDYYQVPQSLNPDIWSVLQTGERFCHSEIELILTNSDSSKKIKLLISREWELIQAGDLQEQVREIAFRTSTRLEILDGTPGQPVDLWSILQVPFGGHIFMPVNGTAAYRNYFDPCPTDDLTIKPGIFELRFGSKVMYKIGLKPDQSTGRIAYARPIENRWLILSRSFPVDPDRNYCDAPLHDLESQGDVIQLFNDGGKFGNFGEMEHRSPALISGEGPQIHEEETITEVMILEDFDFTSWKDSFLST